MTTATRPTLSVSASIGWLARSRDDPGQDFPEHDDDKETEAFDERVRDGERSRDFSSGRQNHRSEAGEVGSVDEAPGWHASSGRQECSADQQDGSRQPSR